jgi:hypothetical protein
MQAITIPSQRFEQAKTRKDFIRQVIFPGGCLPSVEALLASSARVSDLSLVELEDLGPHYAETLRRWRDNLQGCRGDLTSLGLDNRFGRLWEFYLAYCEAGFDERDIGLVQLVLAGPGWTPPDLATWRTAATSAMTSPLERPGMCCGPTTRQSSTASLSSNEAGLGGATAGGSVMRSTRPCCHETHADDPSDRRSARDEDQPQGS